MIAGPTLVHFGAKPLAAHMFIFYSSLLSAITPPVALAAYAGAAIAGGKVMETGFIASRLGFVKFIVPYMFIYNAALLAEGPSVFVAWSPLTAIIGTVAISVAFEGYLFTSVQKWRRSFYLLAGELCLIPELYSDSLGLILGTLLIWLHHRKWRRGKSLPTPPFSGIPQS